MFKKFLIAVCLLFAKSSFAFSISADDKSDLLQIENYLNNTAVPLVNDPQLVTLLSFIGDTGKVSTTLILPLIYNVVLNDSALVCELLFNFYQIKIF